MRRGARLLLLQLMLLLCSTSTRAGQPQPARRCRKVRIATFNTSLNRNKAGQLLAELSGPGCAQAGDIAAILQIVRPQVVLLNEFDYEPSGAAVRAFRDNYLAAPQGAGLEPLHYAHAYAAPVNTGVPSGRDFDHDGRSQGPQDCFGYGFHPGQYGMVLLSEFPIDAASARTFQHFLWADMPGARLPRDPATGLPWYSAADLEVFRLSSKSHWDVEVLVPLGAAPLAAPSAAGGSLKQDDDGGGGDGALVRRVHMLLSHPTPPAFDGRERRNVARNHDEIRLWADYVGCSSGSSSSSSSSSSSGSSYLYDDQGRRGGLPPGATFVICGDQNSDPLDGAAGAPGAITQLLACPAVNASFTPTSEGGREAGNRRPGDRTPPETKTANFSLRADYVLPSRDLDVLGGGVWWPVRADPRSKLLAASDHRPVWLDVRVCAGGAGAGLAPA